MSSTITIPLHSIDLPAQIAEARRKLDRWVASLPQLGPKSGKVRDIWIVRYDGHQVIYEEAVRAMVDSEYKCQY